MIDDYSYKAKNLNNACYVDNEQPIKDNYDKKRRKKRGLFVSNEGIEINADVNGSYQIMKKANIRVRYKGYERVERLKAA